MTISMAPAVGNAHVSATKRCHNCGKEILAEAIKCKHCKEFLSDTPLGREFAHEAIICSNKNCNFKGLPRKVRRANVGLGCLLCLVFFLPGIFYFMFKNGYNYFCPNCGLQIRSDN